MISIRPFATAVILLVGASPALASTYGETLIAQTEQRHSELASVAIEAVGKAGPIKAASGMPAKVVATEALADAMGNRIGTVRFTFHGAVGAKAAPAIAAEMGRRIYLVDNLVENDPFVPGTMRAPLAQKLVDRTIDANPDLVTLAMHVTPPGEPNNVIIASNFGRIGKVGDEDDMHVVNDQAVLKEVTNGGRRLAVSLPMYDRAGAVIGALSTSFTMARGQDQAEVEKRAVAVRDALAAQTPSLAMLASPK